MYEERTYRAIPKPADLMQYEVICKETDLLCSTVSDVRELIEGRVLYYRTLLERYIAARPEFLYSLTPVQPDGLAPPLIREMIEASSSLGIGPMACVAGAVAEFVGRDVGRVSEEYIIENGGDISMKTVHERTVVIHAGKSPYSGRIGLRLRPHPHPYGICTSSGTVGPSLSFGKADALCVVGDSALFADGLATVLGNMVKKAVDIEATLASAKGYRGIKGAIVIMGERMGAWGDLDLVGTG